MVAINWEIIILLFSFNKPYPGISLIAVLTVLKYSTLRKKMNFTFNKIIIFILICNAVR